MSFFLHLHQKETTLNFKGNLFTQKIISSNLKYELISSKKSTNNINLYYYLFFNNYQFVCNYYGEIIYRLITDSKIISILIYKNPYYSPNNQIFALTKSNHLFRFNLESGELISFIYLSNTCKFKSLEWSEPNDSFFVCSKDKNKDFELIYFKCEPFELISKIKIPKSIFEKLTGVNLHKDMFILNKKDSFHFYLQKDIFVISKFI